MYPNHLDCLQGDPGGSGAGVCGCKPDRVGCRQTSSLY